MIDSDEPRVACRELAQALAAARIPLEAAAAVERWMARSAASGDVPAQRRAAAPPAAGGHGRVGIWEPRATDGETWFVRVPELYEPEALLWADVERIGPKRRTRVVLLGESCARSFMLDPLFNCASALRSHLAAVPGGGGVEIVDLARSGIRPEPLAQLARSAHALEPDAFVVFAGNNWIAPSRRLDLEEIAATIAAEGRWAAVAPHFERAVRASVREWLAALASACRPVPALFVIPAVNLADAWLPTLHDPLLGSAGERRREALLAGIDAASAAGDLVRVESAAAELVDLEGGFSVDGLRALARCALARGAAAESARLFERARETFLHLPVYGMQSYSTRTDELRARAPELGFHVVDVPRCFAEIGGGRAPGSDLFLDECHMTSRGIAVAMAAAAEALLPLVGLPARSRDDLLRVPIEVDPRADAQAQALAVFDVLEHDQKRARWHWERALESTREILAPIRHLASALARPGPIVLSADFYEFQRLQSRFPALRSLEGIELSAPAKAAIVRLVREADAAQPPDALAPNEAGAGAGDDRRLEIDVLSHPAAEEFPHWSPPRAYVKCFRHEISFRFEVPAPFPLVLRLTARAPREGGATLLVNGTAVRSWRVGPRWSTVESVVAPPLVSRGANVVTIAWPDPGERSEDRVRAVAAALRSAEMLVDAWPRALLFSVYGELSAFTARVAASPVDGSGRLASGASAV